MFTLALLVVVSDKFSGLKLRIESTNSASSASASATIVNNALIGATKRNIEIADKKSFDLLKKSYNVRNKIENKRRQNVKEEELLLLQRLLKETKDQYEVALSESLRLEDAMIKAGLHMKSIKIQSFQSN